MVRPVYTPVIETLTYDSGLMKLKGKKVFTAGQSGTCTTNEIRTALYNDPTGEVHYDCVVVVNCCTVYDVCQGHWIIH